MKRKQKYSDEPLGRLKIVEDFLPPLDQLVLQVDGVKATPPHPRGPKKGNVPFSRKIPR